MTHTQQIIQDARAAGYRYPQVDAPGDSQHIQGEVESEEQYLVRYLRGRVFKIVQHFDPDALSNPFEVQEIMRDMASYLSERNTNLARHILEEQVKMVEGMMLEARTVSQFMKPCKYNEALRDIKQSLQEQLDALDV